MQLFKLRSCLWIISLLLYSVIGLAWNQVGHQVVAQIAYDNLSPEAKQKADELTEVFNQTQGLKQSFVQSSTWADNLISRNITSYNTWHYVNIPLNQEGRHQVYYSQTNVIWAIEQAMAVLQNNKASPFEKAFYLRFLIHFVGDIHQPLHTVNLYNRRFVHGDAGGNLYLIKDGRLKNLHSYWDQCVNLTSHRYKTQMAIKQLALQLQARYPKAYFGAQIKQTNPKQFAAQSYALAATFVYDTPYGAKISKAYAKQSQIICQQQLTLAGYRLANMLNAVL